MLPLNLTIGARIAFFRKEKKMSQDDLALKLGKSRSSIATYEANKVHLTPYQLKEIANALEIKLTDLTDVDEKEKALTEHLKNAELSIEDYKNKLLQKDFELNAITTELNHKKLLIEEKEKLLKEKERIILTLETQLNQLNTSVENNQKLYDVLIKRFIGIGA